MVRRGECREAPSVVKIDSWYYVFSSRASGWLPSEPRYVLATSLEGPYSDGIAMGNTATF